MTKPPLFALPAGALRASSGVNRGEILGTPEELVMGDGYILDGQSATELDRGAVQLASLVFMTATGTSVEAVLVDGPRLGLVPLGPMEPGIEYLLIAITDPPDALEPPDLRGLSLARGARITMSDGSQHPVERLNPGQRVLTRDAGMQTVREVRRRTVQAAGAFAPVVFAQGAQGNAETLTVGQTFHMLVSNWRAEVLTGARDVLIAARDLLNEDTIYLRRGGFVEYITPVFDSPQVIYAEGVPCESGGRAASPRVTLTSDQARVLLRQMGRG